MARTISIQVKKRLPYKTLIKRIKSEKNVKVLPRLLFIKHLYEDISIEDAAKHVGISKPTAYTWLKKWNEKGYRGLKPQYNGGRPSKLSDSQKEELKHILDSLDCWTTGDVRKIIFRAFKVEYSLKQVRVILRKFGMNLAKPYVRDYRRPIDAEDILKKDCRLWIETQ